MNGCEYFEQLCAVSIDGTLTDEERKSLEAHLAECPSCAALYEELHQMDELLHTPVTIPPSLHANIMACVREEAKPKIVQLEKPIRRSPVIAFVAAAAVVALVAMGGGIGQFFNLLEQMGFSTGLSMGGAGGNAENWNMSGSIEDGIASREAGEPGADQAPVGFSSSAAVPKEARSGDVPTESESANDTDDNAGAEWPTNSASGGGVTSGAGGYSGDYAGGSSGGGATSGTGGYSHNSFDSSSAHNPGSHSDNSSDSNADGGWTTYSGSTGTDSASAAPAPILPQLGAEAENNDWPGSADSDDSGSGVGKADKRNRMAEEAAQTPAAYDNTAISLPDSIQGSVVAHCYLAVGKGELPSIDGDLLVTEEDISYFSVANNMSLLEKTLSDIEEAGYRVTPYEGVGLVTDAKAASWLLIVQNQ